MSTFLHAVNFSSKIIKKKVLTRLASELVIGLNDFLDDGTVALVLLLYHLGLHAGPLIHQIRGDVRVLLVDL
jgi:hypothetical protein